MKTNKIITGIIFFVVAGFYLSGCAQKSETIMEFNKLTFDEEQVIVHKGTERPYTGEYVDNKEKGLYTCKRCDAALYNSSDKFDSDCGWPSFDDEIDGAVKRIPDADGRRTEIVCTNCDGHLGHVFEGERLTDKNTRHCVNSISMNFVPDDKKQDTKTEKAIFAGGCFWGVEYYMEKNPGVISVTSGYTGGYVSYPSYEDVLSKRSGHIEAVEIVFDPSKTSFEELAKLFFEIHDPTQDDRQGPDVGEQYRSEVFYLNKEQKETTEKLIQVLEEKGYKVATNVNKAKTFWPAEDYHQNYYSRKGSLPYCHGYTKRF